ncbi:MAG: hypothetical protein ACOCWR_11110 [Oceanidesulfovibrio sp.]
MAIRRIVLCLALIIAIGAPATAQDLDPLQEPDPAEEAIRNEDMSPEAVTRRYSGVYSVGPDHFVSIIDGRDAGNWLIFYDHATGLMRPLTHFKGRVYTYGPSFDAHEPCAGSVTLLTKDDSQRIFWLPDTPPAQMGWKLPMTPEESQVLGHGALQRP